MPAAHGELRRRSGGGVGTTRAAQPTALQTGRRPHRHSHRRRRRGRWWQQLRSAHPRPLADDEAPRAAARGLPIVLEPALENPAVFETLSQTPYGPLQNAAHRPPRRRCDKPSPSGRCGHHPAQSGSIWHRIADPQPPPTWPKCDLLHRAKSLIWAMKADKRWRIRLSRWTPVEPLSSGTPSAVPPASLFQTTGQVAGLCV